MTAAAMVTCLMLGGVGCSGSEAGTSTPIGTSAAPDPAQVLGPANEATGAPIKVGFVVDGKTDSVDTTSELDSAKATVSYINEHLGGINGHPVELETCETGLTPTGATTCGVQMVNDKVAVILAPGIGQDKVLHEATKDAGIPYVALATADTGILTGTNSFVLANATGAPAAIAKLAKDKGAKKVAFVVVDVPAATGPIQALAQPIFEKAGLEFQLVPIALSVADQSPQLQQAISGGADLFATYGSEDFSSNAVKTLKQLGFGGQIVLGAGTLNSTTIDSLGGGAEGIVSFTGFDSDPSHPDVQLYQAVLAKYTPDISSNTFTPTGFVATLALVRALKGTEAVDAPSVSKALSSMPAPAEVPLEAGLTFQCGAKLVPLLAAACVKDINMATLDSNGQPQNLQVVEIG